MSPKNKGHTNCYECCDLTKKIRSVTNYRLVVVLVLILTKCFAKLQRSFKNSGKKCHSLALNISYCSTFDFPTPRKDKCIVVLDIFFSSNHNIHKSLSDLCFFRHQTLQSRDFGKIYWLKGLAPKNKHHLNFYECCDLTEKVYLHT